MRRLREVRVALTDRFWLIPPEASPDGEEAVYDAETESLISN